MEKVVMEIANFQQVDERIASSGQPGRDAFAAIAGQGYSSVINLALPSSENAIPDEGALVTGAGMNYFHIPVEWQAPKLSQFKLFASVMEAHAREKVWVHCALNMRTSCFIYLYRVIHGGVERDQAMESMRKVWDCNESWSIFIRQVEADAK
jgi:protein tyrosine phosphatase (PTP) superfamily phosphohydrolase (DUF442 family)